MFLFYRNGVHKTHFRVKRSGNLRGQATSRLLRQWHPTTLGEIVVPESLRNHPDILEMSLNAKLFQRMDGIYDHEAVIAASLNGYRHPCDYRNAREQARRVTENVAQGQAAAAGLATNPSSSSAASVPPQPASSSATPPPPGTCNSRTRRCAE